MISMTGYGKSVYSGEDFQIEFEIKSVNSRFMELRLTLPRELNYLELEINNEIKKKILRGKVTAKLSLISLSKPELKLNETKLLAYKELYKKVQELTGCDENIPIELYLQNEELILKSEDLSSNKELREKILNIINEGIDQHQNSAKVEGESMRTYMHSSISLMQSALSKIEKSFPEYKEEIHNRMHDAAREMFVDKLSEEEYSRLALEIALYIEKSDVTEEIVRLNHHFQKFDKLMDKEGSMGKTLNFILQEMHREINTLGSKYGKNEVFDEMIMIKEEIEKCREIVQNVV